MRIIRSAPGRFVIVPQDSARDELLSLSAAGLLAYLLTHADGYPVTADEVERRRPKDSRRTVRAAMRELEAAGYLRRERVPLEGGRWSTELVLSDTPTRNTEGGGTNTPTEVLVSGASERRHPGSPAPRSAESSAGGASIRRTTEKNQGEVPERSTRENYYF